MPRINPVKIETANQKTQEILATVKKKMGRVPNLISTMAQAPAVANAYLGFSQALATGNLPARLREQIALAVGEANSCNYCVSAHTAIGKGVGLDETSALAARQASAAEGRSQAALEFAQKLVQARGKVTDADFNQLKTEGFSEGEIGEIVANVALNIFTNYFNHVADTEIDFPVAPELVSA